MREEKIMQEKIFKTTGRRIVFVGVGFILLFWCVDILIDAYLFREGTFLSQLLDPEPYEIYVRTIIVVIILANTIYARYIANQLYSVNSQLNTELAERKQAEQQLADSEIELRALFASMHDVVLVIDRDGVYRKIAPTDPGLLYKPPKELLGKTLRDVFPPEEAETLLSSVQKVLETQQTLKVEYKLTIGEHPLWFETFISSMTENSTLWVARDVTDRKSTEDALLDASEILVRNLTELEQRNLEISLLNKMVASFQASLTTEEVYAIAEQACAQLFPEEAGTLFRLNPSQDICEPVVVWGISPAQNTLTAFLPNDCPVLQNGQAHLAEVGYPSHCSHSVDGLAAAHMCIPLIAHGKTVGVLSLQNEDKSDLHMTLAKQQLALTVADTTALALANLNLSETLRQQAIRDPLTGLFNRRYLEETLEREVQRAQRNHQPVGIIMIDIDFFKAINDNYGHEAGDAALSELGSFLLAHIRREDIACRFGGEEFILILPGATLLTTRTRAELLQDGLKQLRIQHNGQLLEGLTLSFGVALYPDHGSTGMAVIRSADMALYRAKQTGRNRIEMGREEQAETDGLIIKL
ncbi:MAG: diguanylate cyclase [Anaerolineaceae bacterium]|nr:MAG: diguanylate cyclase [Anaerolineaceae bacterium]